MTAAVLIGGLVYAGASPKVANAPLQPPVAVPTAAQAITRTFERDRDDDDDDDDRAIPTPRPTARTQPRATLAPGIRTTPQTPTTRTRVS